MFLFLEVSKGESALQETKNASLSACILTIVAEAGFERATSRL